MVKLIAFVFLTIICLVQTQETFDSENDLAYMVVVAEPLVTNENTTEGFETLKPTYLVINGNPIDLSGYPIGAKPISFLVNYTDPNYESIVSTINETHMPVVVGADQSHIPFNLTKYFDQLETKSFGQNLIIGDVIPSTMDIGHDFGTIHGLVLIANMQSRGRGSNNSKWESPRGDIYMNINLKLRNQSRAGLLPAHCALSLIKAVQTTPIGDYSKLPIKFSWPISMTWMPWNKKIGGVLVEPTFTNEVNGFWYTSGCGLRVNSNLTYSVSKMIDEHNAKHPTEKVPQIDIPGLIARAVNYLEEYFKLLESDPDGFNELIMDNWVNHKQNVIINVQSEIVGLTSDGSLIIKDNKGFTAYLKPNAERFGFEPKQLIN